MTLSPRNGRSAAGWLSFRNVLLALIAMQLLVLIAIGFSAPSETTFEDIFLPASPALDSLLASLSSPQKNRKNALDITFDSLQATFQVRETLSDEFEKVKTYDTKGAYTNNFLPERRHPSFRHNASSLEHLDSLMTTSVKNLSLLLHGTKLQACRYYKLDPHGQIRVLFRKECRVPPAGEIVAYNAFSVERKWCGKVIPPHSFQRYYGSICDDASHLFGGVALPPVSPGRKMPPIVLQRENDETSPRRIRCNVPCKATLEKKCNVEHPHTCLPDVTKWTVEDAPSLQFLYSILSTSQNGNLVIDKKAYRDGTYLATRSFDSEIPLSYFDWQDYSDDAPMPPAVDYNDAIHGVSLFLQQCRKGALRGDVWANATQLVVRLDSYGACLHNTDVPDGMSLQNKQDRETLLKKYLFTLIIDETLDADVVNEAVWEVLRAGVIPIYYGATNIKDHVPPNSIISAADFGTKVATAEHVQQVMNDRALWEFYHEWRQHAFPEALKQKYEFLHTSSFCRMCKWSYAKKYGLGWNHSRQEVQAREIGGRLCFCRNGALMYPFQEMWMTPTLSKGPKGSCNRNWPNNTPIKSTVMIVNRTAIQHDGVVDLRLDDTVHDEGDLVVRFQFKVKNRDGAHFSNVHQMVDSEMVPFMSSVAIQDDRAKVTVVCDWPTRAWSPGEGAIQIQVQSNEEGPLSKDERRTIRIIPEDVDSLRDVRTEYALSPYAKQMIEDFANPLQLFLVES